MCLYDSLIKREPTAGALLSELLQIKQLESLLRSTQAGLPPLAQTRSDLGERTFTSHYTRSISDRGHTSVLLCTCSLHEAHATLPTPLYNKVTGIHPHP